MKRVDWWSIIFVCALLVGGLLAVTGHGETLPALTSEQQATYDAAAKEFYFSQAVVSETIAQLNGLQLQLARQQKALESARDKLKASCPGDLIDVDGHPAECRPKAIP